jgi:hypothetical protein
MTTSRTAKVAIGHVLHLHDRDTGFSTKDVYRWCVVTAIVARNMRVAGRSTTRTDRVPVPVTAIAERRTRRLTPEASQA